MSKPLRERVGVVIPCYNHGQYLAGAIESVLGQTAPVAEIIVVDDGSTDDTAKVAARYAASVQYVYQEHRGVSVARNRGVLASKSRWIAFLDSDDRWLPEKTACQLDAVAAHPETAVLFADVRHVSHEGEYQETGLDRNRPGTKMVDWSRWNDPPLWLSTGSLIEPVLRGLDACVCTLLMRRDAFDRLGGFDEEFRLAEDLEFPLRMAEQGYVFGLIPKPLALIWQHSHSQCRNNSEINEYILRALMALEERRKLSPSEKRVVRECKAECHICMTWSARKQGNYQLARWYARQAVRNGLVVRGVREWLYSLPMIREMSADAASRRCLP